MISISRLFHFSEKVFQDSIKKLIQEIIPLEYIKEDIANANIFACIENEELEHSMILLNEIISKQRDYSDRDNNLIIENNHTDEMAQWKYDLIIYNHLQKPLELYSKNKLESSLFLIAFSIFEFKKIVGISLSSITFSKPSNFVNIGKLFLET